MKIKPAHPFFKWVLIMGFGEHYNMYKYVFFHFITKYKDTRLILSWPSRKHNIIYVLTARTM